MVERGTRYKCYKCETGFYDLGRPQPICPSCGEDQNNREVAYTYKRKKRRSYSKMESDIHVLHEEREDIHEHEESEHEESEHEESEHEESGHEESSHSNESEDDSHEYVLEKEDIALEESTDGDDSG